METKISGVILAGGLNSRFGGITKAKVNVGGKPVVERILDSIRGIFHEIIIVTNTPEEFAEYSDCVLTGDYYREAGPLGGIHAALGAVSAEAAFVIAGDMPLISRDLVLNQVERYKSNDYEVLVARINVFIEPLHAVYSCSIHERLVRYIADNKKLAVYEFLKTVSTGYFDPELSDDTLNVFMNVNTPSDIQIIEKILTDREGK